MPTPALTIALGLITTAERFVAVVAIVIGG